MGIATGILTTVPNGLTQWWLLGTENELVGHVDILEDIKYTKIADAGADKVVSPASHAGKPGF